ncbi:protein kinase domain-containing protein [Fusobacterium ulcerans]|uniref:protein kinase domain-containing protein n=1 Tax=Fusobacterium ulcerans TaxID=861 RepID=UPI002E7889C6|nr:RIO1 family regulatory kinase/ATPase [Fusobacterium ulcerans]MEE0139403.1 RIO1 family regulatory kinase/ATPase [Fusobacterium ulcerans]
MERKQLDSVLLREGEQFITYLITDEKGEKGILKLINPEYLKYDERYEKVKEQFQFEKQLLNLLKIEGIPKYIDGGENFLHLSYISGENLKKYVKMKELTLDEIENIICSIGEIVKKLHRYRVIHCDIKPENIIYDGEKISLIDFGSGAFQGEESIYIQGSKGFSAPEIYIKGMKRDIEDDTYSIAAVYQWLLNEKGYIDNIKDNGIFKIGLADKREKRFKSTDELIGAIKKIRRE